MKNPCLSCDLGDFSKDNSTCKHCDDRVLYVNYIENPILSSNIRILKRPSIDKLKKAEIYIQKTCEKYFVDFNDMKSRRVTGNLRDVRREIVHTLRHEFKLPLLEIGKLLNKSSPAIGVILNKKEVKPTGKNQTNKTTPTNTTGQSYKRTTGKPLDKNYIYIDFKNLHDLYERLVVVADRNFRTPEGQVLFIINEAVNNDG